jgi:hypothetical protein
LTDESPFHGRLRSPLDTVAQVVEQLRALLDAAIDYPIVNFVDTWEEETLSLFAEAVRLA